MLIKVSIAKHCLGSNQQKKCLTAFLLLIFSFDLLAVSGIGIVNSGPNYLSGEFVETVEDMQVKVSGGYLQVRRTFSNKQWTFNRGAEGMSFEYGREHDSLPNKITVAGERFLLDASSIKTAEGDATSTEESVATYFSENQSELAVPSSRIDKTGEGYRWADIKGNWLSYDDEGQLVQGGNRNTLTTQVVKDLQNRVFQVLDANDTLILTYEYLAADSNQIKTITDYSGRVVEYTYDGQQLTQVKDVLGQIWAYSYNERSELIKKTDPLGRETNIFYAMGDVIRIENAEKFSHEFSYNWDQLRKHNYFKVKDSSGKTTETFYDADGLLIKKLVDGKIIQQASAINVGLNRIFSSLDAQGKKVSRTVDQSGNTLKLSYFDGSSEQFEYGGPFNSISQYTGVDGFVTTYSYDANGNLLSLVEANTTSLERTVNYQYDAFGRPVVITYPGDELTEAVSYSLSYDSFGNISSKLDALGHKTEYKYSVIGKPTERKDALGNIWTSVYDAAGNILDLKDPLNQQYQATYDAAGQRTKLIAPNNRESSLNYDQLGRLKQLISGQSENSPQINYQHDDIARSLNVSNALGDSANFYYNSRQQLTSKVDPNGNLTQVSYKGALTDEIKTASYSQQLSYDLSGRVSQNQLSWTSADQTYQQIRSQQYTQNNQPSIYTDAEGNQHQVSYDALGRMIQRIDPLGGITQFTYNKRNQLLSVTDAEGRITRFEYDKNGRTIAEIREPNAGQLLRREYDYDANGNLTVERTPKGERIEHDFNVVNQRVVSRYYDTANQLSKTINFQYSLLGQLTSYSDGATSQTYTYNTLGQLTQIETNYGAFTKTQSYTYDKRGLKASYTNPEGETYHYSYDANGNIQTVTIPQQGQVTYNSYAINQPTQITLPGGIKQLLTYDGLQRLQSRELIDPAGNPISQAVYSYDKENNILGFNTEHGDYSFGYDDGYRLTSATKVGTDPLGHAPENETYTYDKVHNRLSSHDTASEWQYNGSNQLLGFDNTTYEYDANGNRTKKIISVEGAEPIETNYSYDAAERLVSVDGNAYYYNPLGQRLWKAVSGVKTYFLYDQTGLLAEYNDAGQLITEYHYTPNSPFMTRPLFMRQASQVYYYQNDHLGTPQQLISNTGAVVWAARYAAFGKASVVINTIENNLRFPGQYYDAETGTHYNYFRDYEPSLGRYVQTDPIGLSGGINTYGYVSNNPVNYVDPYGLFELISDGGTSGQRYQLQTWGDNMYKFLSNGNGYCPNCGVNGLASFEKWRVEISNSYGHHQALTWAADDPNNPYPGMAFTRFFQSGFSPDASQWNETLFGHEFGHVTGDVGGHGFNDSSDGSDGDLFGARLNGSMYGDGTSCPIN